MSLTHLGCPSCGGTLSLAEGQRLVSCPYCGGESLVLIPGAVPRYAVAQGISREEAGAAVLRLLAGPRLPRALRERGRIQDISLCYVPFYEFTGTRRGMFLLREKEEPPPPQAEDNDGDVALQRWMLEPSVVREDTRVIQQQYLRIGPACELRELGVDCIPLESLRRGATPVLLEPFDLVRLQRRAVVFAPTKPPEAFAEESQRRIKVRSDQTALVARRLKILYYPLWQARYLFRGRPYEVAVDAVTGKVLRGRAPAGLRQAVAIAVAALALAALCVGRPARHFITTGLAAADPTGWLSGATEALLALLAGGAAAAFLTWVAWIAFRQSGELVLGEDQAEFRLDLESGSGGLPQAVATLMKQLLAGGTSASKRE